MAAPEETGMSHIAYDEGHPTKLRFTLFGDAEDSLAAERQLAEEALEEAAREAGTTLKKHPIKSKKKPGRKPAPPGEAGGKKGQGNHGSDNPPVWTDAENLALLKLVRDSPSMPWTDIAKQFNASFWAGDEKFAGRSVNGCRPQYRKVMGNKREVTVGKLPGKIQELEEKLRT